MADPQGVTGVTTSADLDRMVRELTEAGWTPKTPTIWQSPRGILHLGPAGAWRRMREEQARDRPRSGSHT